jgi:hypothetical protein
MSIPKLKPPGYDASVWHRPPHANKKLANKNAIK